MSKRAGKLVLLSGQGTNEEIEEEANESRPDVDTQTLSLVLELAQQKYQEEEGRRKGVESKIGIVVTVDTLIISFTSLFSQGVPWWITTIALTPALISGAVGLLTIRSRLYKQAGPEPDDLYQYLNDDPDNLKDTLIMSHIVALTGESADDTGNIGENRRKYQNFDFCVFLTGVSLAFVSALPLLAGIDMIPSAGTPNGSTQSPASSAVGIFLFIFAIVVDIFVFR